MQLETEKSDANQNQEHTHEKPRAAADQNKENNTPCAYAKGNPLIQETKMADGFLIRLRLVVNNTDEKHLRQTKTPSRGQKR